MGRHLVPAYRTNTDITDVPPPFSPEIQELRHQDLGLSNQSSSKGTPSSPPSSTGVIDQALIHLDERLEAVSKSIGTIEDTLEPLLRSTLADDSRSSKSGSESGKGKGSVNGNGNSNGSGSGNEADILILRKHAALLAEWENVQNEAENLRDELKEDKWLAVFRNASEQADSMMASLDKAASQCHVRPPLDLRFIFFDVGFGPCVLTSRFWVVLSLSLGFRITSTTAARP